MSAETQDDRRQRDEDDMPEDAGAIEGFDLRPGADNVEAAPEQQPQDPPEELEEERRG